MKIEIFVAAIIAVAPAIAHSQHATYSGEESRAIKALSADETKQYLAGAGMGYARAAELNHYPGPMHVLELAGKLELSAEQRENTKRLMDAHKAEARAIGAKLVEAERALDRLFASGKVTDIALAEHVRAVAALHGEYRLSHLDTHRRMRDILTSHQVRRYDELRGYTGEGARAAEHGKKHH
jgi:Spy/CpxP family protein refolding chaperone